MRFKKKSLLFCFYAIPTYSKNHGDVKFQQVVFPCTAALQLSHCCQCCGLLWMLRLDNDTCEPYNLTCSTSWSFWGFQRSVWMQKPWTYLAKPNRLSGEVGLCALGKHCMCQSWLLLMFLSFEKHNTFHCHHAIHNEIARTEWLFLSCCDWTPHHSGPVWVAKCLTQVLDSECHD